MYNVIDMNKCFLVIFSIIDLQFVLFFLQFCY